MRTYRKRPIFLFKLHLRSHYQFALGVKPGNRRYHLHISYLTGKKEEFWV